MEREERGKRWNVRKGRIPAIGTFLTSPTFSQDRELWIQHGE